MLADAVAAVSRSVGDHHRAPQVEAARRRARALGLVRPSAGLHRVIGGLRLLGDAVAADQPGRLQRSAAQRPQRRSEEHTSELQSLMRISYAVFCLKKKKKKTQSTQ